MKTGARMTCDVRKQQILGAVRRVFARKGLAGATTKALAKEAGVSEALLYKHYPSKEALYQAMLTSCYDKFLEEMDKIASLEPSTSTLVSLAHFHASVLLDKRDVDRDLLVRLYLRSLTEDGDFARFAFKKKHGPSSYVAKLEECIAASVASGDIVESPISKRLRAVFAGRLPFDIMTTFLPATPVVDYGLSREKLIEQIVWFVLRGIGLKDEAIQRHYNPKALALLAS